MKTIVTFLFVILAQLTILSCKGQTKSNQSIAEKNGKGGTGSAVTECSPDCYSGAQDLAIGEARLGPGGATMVIQYANGDSGFKVWKEKDGSRILNASGDVTKGWQQTLNRKGLGFSGTDLTSSEHIAGRVCPPNVFLDHSSMTAGGRCMYYDHGKDSANLAVTCPYSEADGVNLSLCAGVEAEDYLADWNRANSGRGSSASYYEGNIKICADRGMRLPTVYELATTGTTTNLPTGDGLSATPSWAGTANGVPMIPNTTMWTASAATNSGTYFISTGSAIDSDAYTAANGAYGIRCVLPNN